jgi:Zn-dependent peptidase ImmA (M78 family)
MAVLDRGFKSWAERTSLGLRRELGLSARSRLDPHQLASYLAVIVWTPRDVPGMPEKALYQLLQRDPWGWSAVTCTVGEQAIVIYNPSHPPGRQAGDITHELAHVLLDHKAGTLIMSQDGAMVMRSYDRKQEEEADWLSRCLLLPRDSLMWARRERLTPGQIAVHFGVTEPLVVYRLRMTGVDAQMKAASRRRP